MILDAGNGREIPTAVTEIVPAVDPATRTFLVKADLPRGAGRTGQSGRIRFAAGRGSALTVPKSAVTRAGGGDGLFIMAGDNVVRLVPVTLGAPFDDRVEVLSGLSPGTRVAVSPVDRLADGDRVEARK